jgi:hypothetical protein
MALRIGRVLVGPNAAVLSRFDRLKSKNDLWHLSLSTTELERITDGRSAVAPCCTPGGKWIAYGLKGMRLLTSIKMDQQNLLHAALNRQTAGAANAIQYRTDAGHCRCVVARW